MPYNTNNPIGSTDPRDLYDNAGIFDNFSSGEQPFYPNRFGQQGLSLSGIRQDFQTAQVGREAEFQKFLSESGFAWIGDYAAGLTFTNRSQYITRENLAYRLAPTATLPYLTTGNWALEHSSFVLFPNEDVLRQELAESNGSSLVGYQASGPDRESRTVQDKLRDVVSRADYRTDSAFNAAKVGRVAIDANGDISGGVAPAGGGASIALADTARDAKKALECQFPIGPRPVLRYGSATSVLFSVKTMPMGEFRFGGGYTGGLSRVLPLASGAATVLAAGLGAESSRAVENWYAAFAVANAGDKMAIIKTMPFLRVGSVAGSVITLNKAGERIHTVQARSYAWVSPNNLAGCKCLIVAQNGVFSGRIATIVENTAATITLDTVGSLAFGDFILPAPPGYSEFGYMGTFYFDTEEVRNIYDTGVEVRSYGVQYAPATNGALTNLALDFGGYISPLASGVVLSLNTTLGTGSTGDMAEYFSPDSGGHTVANTYFYKQLSTSMPSVHDGLVIPFLYSSKCYLTTGGSLQGSRTPSNLFARGWFES